MNLRDELKKFNTISTLSGETKFKVVCSDNTVLIGHFYGYTQAVDNEPEEAQLDIITDTGSVIGILESDIKSIQVEAI